jgi:phosphonate transport system substrate-binding protein
MRRRDCLRRIWQGAVALALAGGSTSLLADPEQSPIRIGITPAFLHDQHVVLENWRRYLQQRLRHPVEFVARDRYRDTIDLLEQGALDYAWICGYPFVMLKDTVRLMAVPVHRGKPLFRSYLIVPAKDSRTQSITDLRGGVFAYADPLSNTGYLAPRYEIKKAGGDPASFFKLTFFTWSHRKTIEAVASGLAQGAAVDSFVWDSLARVSPQITGRTRIVSQSPEYGFPPLVAHRHVSEANFREMQRALAGMAQDEAGRQLLQALNLDGFIPGERKLYDSVAEMMRSVAEP